MASWKDTLDQMIAQQVNELAGVNRQIAGILKSEDHWFSWDKVYEGVQNETKWKLELFLPIKAVSVSTDYAVAMQSWISDQVYASGEVVHPQSPNGYAYRATSPGTANSIEPTWPTIHGVSVSDNTVSWECDIWLFKSVDISFTSGYAVSSLGRWAVVGQIRNTGNRTVYGYRIGPAWDNNQDILKWVTDWATMQILRTHIYYGSLTKASELGVVRGYLQYFKDVITWRNAILADYTGRSPSFSDAYGYGFDRVA